MRRFARFPFFCIRAFPMGKKSQLHICLSKRFQSKRRKHLLHFCGISVSETIVVHFVVKLCNFIRTGETVNGPLVDSRAVDSKNSFYGVTQNQMYLRDEFSQIFISTNLYASLWFELCPEVTLKRAVQM